MYSGCEAILMLENMYKRKHEVNEGAGPAVTEQQLFFMN